MAMEIEHNLDVWRELYVMVGTSAAALIGLLFVASSLHLGEMSADKALRLRSRNVTLHLVALLVQAIAILTPQPLLPLGIEVVIVNMCGAVLPLSLTTRVFRQGGEDGGHGAVSVYRWLGYLGCYGLGIAGGVALTRGLISGLYAVTLSNAFFFVAVVWDAWKMLLGLRETATSRAGANHSR